MSIFWSIRKTVNQVARALSFAINTEISIADQDLILVAGSKYYEDLIGKQIQNRIGKKMQDRNIYETIKKQGRPLIINNPGYNDLCRGCRLYGKCPEKYEINHPILLKGNLIGIISLVAIDDLQKEKLLKNKASYMNFTCEMANLLAGKAAEWKMSREIKEMATQLNAIINSTQDGIIAIDKSYNINFINPVAKEILELEDGTGNYKFSKIFPDYSLNDIIKEGLKHTNCELKYVSPGGKKGRIMASITPIEMEKCICGAVMVIKTMEEVRDIINSISGSNRGFSFDRLVGKSEKMKKLIAKAQKVSKSNSSILITGESGTGKELLARAIHEHAYGESAPFVAVNCAAIPGELLESELFGYEEGAFTGAKKGGKQGKFELADGGTLFLDEIGDMPLHLQAKLLRVLNSKERFITRVGGTDKIFVNTRIISATNKELVKLIENNKFREDLYYRLNVIPLSIPPLRDRKEDIKMLVNYFINMYNKILGQEISSISEKTYEVFYSYNWPGNVRELENAIEYAVNMVDCNSIDFECLPAYIKRKSVEKDRPGNLKDIIEEYERNIVKNTLKKYENTVEGKKMAAQELGISLPSLYRKL